MWERIVDLPYGIRMHAEFREAIGMTLLLGEMYEPALTQRVAANLGRGGVFVDVGANMGYYTLLASRLVGNDGLVLAFEPSHANLAQLGKNLMLNGCQNVLVFSEALSDCARVAKLSLPWVFNSGVCSLGNGPSSGLSESGRFTLTPTRRFDDVVASIGLDRPVSVVKIDAEGHEPQVVRGMEKLLRSTPNVQLVCELASMSYPVADFISNLRSLGFRGEYYRNGKWQVVDPTTIPDRSLYNAWFSRQ
jgi:FkbM family methyltransferase